MVQTLINEVRRLETEQNNNLQVIQRLRAQQFLTVPPAEPSEEPMHHHWQLLQDAESSTRELGSRLCFQVTKHVGRLEFQVALSVVDLQLGRMMEAAELAAYANTWLPSEPLNQDMDAQLRYLLVMLTSRPALQIIRQQPSGVQASRDLVRRYNPRSTAARDHAF